jgi:CRISPR-associated endonuclease/helicase Cas3
VGKAHAVFQQMLVERLPADDPRRDSDLWAKSDGAHGGRAKRPHFRHELASALAFLDQGASDLEAYVVAAHHGKARLTIRGRPTERPDPERGRPILGVLDGDTLPEVDLGAGEVSAALTLHLDALSLGGGASGASWMTRTQGLLAELGPFRLAWCESLVRVADWEASRLRTTGELDWRTELGVLGGAS